MVDFLEHDNKLLSLIKDLKLFNELKDFQLPKEDSTSWSSLVH
jgi:hypothetical protein